MNTNPYIKNYKEDAAAILLKAKRLVDLIDQLDIMSRVMTNEELDCDEVRDLESRISVIAENICSISSSIG